MSIDTVDVKAEFIPIRGWQAVDFIRLNLGLMQGHDPLADRILARPWTWFSLRAYVYLLLTFFRSDSFFLEVAGQRAGLLSVAHQDGLAFVFGLGLFPGYQQRGLGQQAATFLEDLARRRRCTALVAAMSAGNAPVHRLVELCGGRLLGLATTDLALGPLPAWPRPANGLEVRPLPKSEAQQAWQRWRLYEVEQVAGPEAVEIAARLLKWEYLPRGKYLALVCEGREAGFAFASAGRRSGEMAVGLFPATTFWASRETAGLVRAIAGHLGTAIHKLTLTQTHADALTACADFNFDRLRSKERHVAFKRL
ncbi:MAG: GNAT family N-acetyltransferase [Anaerolineae bacterium]